MKKINKTSYPPIHMGTSLMLVIFIILCMIVFAVLSLSSSLKDYDYSQKNAQRTTNYYEACNQAEKSIADIHQLLTSSSSFESALDKIEDLGYVAVSDDHLAQFHVAIDDNEFLQVVLDLKPANGDDYRIATWKSVSSDEWDGNQTLPVLGSEK